MERIVLHTDQARFELAVQQYGRVADLKMRIKKELKTLLPKLKVKEDFFSNVMENFWKELGKAHPKHLELMHPNKIPGLLDLDIKLLQSLANEFDLVKHTKNPSISSYEVLAETEEEIKQYKAVTKVIEALKEAEEVCGFQVSRGDIMRGTKTWIYADIYNQGMSFNYRLLMDKRRAEARKELLEV